MTKWDANTLEYKFNESLNIFCDLTLSLNASGISIVASPDGKQNFDYIEQKQELKQIFKDEKYFPIVLKYFKSKSNYRNIDCFTSPQSSVWTLFSESIQESHKEENFRTEFIDLLISNYDSFPDQVLSIINVGLPYQKDCNRELVKFLLSKANQLNSVPRTLQKCLITAYFSSPKDFQSLISEQDFVLQNYIQSLKLPFVLNAAKSYGDIVMLASKFESDLFESAHETDVPIHAIQQFHTKIMALKKENRLLHSKVEQLKLEICESKAPKGLHESISNYRWNDTNVNSLQHENVQLRQKVQALQLKIAEMDQEIDTNSFALATSSSPDYTITEASLNNSKTISSNSSPLSVVDNKTPVKSAQSQQVHEYLDTISELKISLENNRKERTALLNQISTLSNQMDQEVYVRDQIEGKNKSLETKISNLNEINDSLRQQSNQMEVSHQTKLKAMNETSAMKSKLIEKIRAQFPQYSL